MIFPSITVIAAVILCAAESVTSLSPYPEDLCIQDKFEAHFSGTSLPNVLADATLRVEKASTGEVIYSKDADKTFEATSITKMFVGTVFNQLIDEGKVWYKDPFTEYLPKDLDTSKWCTTGNIKSITLMDLLRHTSGLQDIWDEDTAFYKDWIYYGHDYVWTPRQVLDYIPQLTKNYCTTKDLSSDPFTYADTNFVILGIIIEHITQNTLASEIRTRILEPVGMANTFMLQYESENGLPVGTSCDAPNMDWIGDGWCDGDEYNKAECNFDGGDCCDYSCDGSTTHGCTGGISKDVACKVKMPFWNHGIYTTGFRSFTADWGGGGYVSTADDLAKFIKAWYRDPKVLFCPKTSRCRMNSEEMMFWDDDDGYGYSMGMLIVDYSNGKFGYGHNGYNNSFMSYVGPNGLIVTGTLNWYNGKDTDLYAYSVVKEMLSCIDTDGDDWLYDCPGESHDQYFNKVEQCKRACNVWDWAGYEYWQCHDECIYAANKGGDAVWDDLYVTCLERNRNCLDGGKSKINNYVCEYETGCPHTCTNSYMNWWDCIPQCEHDYGMQTLREAQVSMK